MVTAKTGRPRRGELVLTHFLTVREVALSGGFYADIFGGEVMLEEHPSIVICLPTAG